MYEIGQSLFDDQNLLHDLWLAYFDARKHKRNTLNAIRFEQNLEHNMYELYREVAEYRYELSPSICFIVDKPVKREIFAAHFRDRIIHHYIIMKLMPIFENQFIYDSYSCRVGKGTLFGIKRLEHFMRSCTENYTKEAYVMKLDLTGFFMSIKRSRLLAMVNKLVSSKYSGNDKEMLLYLVEKLIMNDPTKGCIIRGSRSDWVGLPPNKSLFYANEGCGIPIGNLTSQIFANYYLTGFDRFVKETLKVRYYGRYVDDFFLVDRDVTLLKHSMEKMRWFLGKCLELKIHPKKLYVQPCRRGVRYLGVYVTPWGIFPSHRLRQHFKDFLMQNDPSSAPVPVMEDKYQFQSAYNSYFGMWHHILVYRDFLERTEIPHLAYLLCDTVPPLFRYPRELKVRNSG